MVSFKFRVKWRCSRPGVWKVVQSPVFRARGSLLAGHRRVTLTVQVICPDERGCNVSRGFNSVTAPLGPHTGTREDLFPCRKCDTRLTLVSIREQASPAPNEASLRSCICFWPWTRKELQNGPVRLPETNDAWATSRIITASDVNGAISQQPLARQRPSTAASPHAGTEAHPPAGRQAEPLWSRTLSSERIPGEDSRSLVGRDLAGDASEQ